VPKVADAVCSLAAESALIDGEAVAFRSPPPGLGALGGQCVETIRQRRKGTPIVVATLPLGSVGYEPELNSTGERRIWIEAAVADRPSLTCLVVTKASPWGHTCGDFATRLAFGLVGDFASGWNGGRSSGGLIGTCRHLVGIAVTTPTGRKEPRHRAGPGMSPNAPSAHPFRAPFGVPDLYHYMVKPRRVAIPVAEDRQKWGHHRIC